MDGREQKLDPFSLGASRAKRSVHEVFLEALRPLGDAGEIEMAVALTLKKCGQTALPAELPMLRALVYGPLLSTLKTLFDPEAARPAVEHLYAELKRWAKDEDDSPAESGVRDIQGEPAKRAPTRRRGAVDVREEMGPSRREASAERPKRERKTSAVMEEQVVQGHRDFGAQRRASDQGVRAQKPAAPVRDVLGAARHGTAPPPPPGSHQAITGAPPPASSADEFTSVDMEFKTPIGVASPLLTAPPAASPSPMVTAPPAAGPPAVTTPPDPFGDAPESDDTGEAFGSSLRPKRRTIPTPIQMLPPVLVLSTEPGLGFRIRAALQEQADVTVFQDGESLLGAAGNLIKLDPIVLLDGRDEQRAALVQETVAFAPEALRVVMWGWVDEDLVGDGSDLRRVRCDAAVEPEDLGALIQALVSARSGG